MADITFEKLVEAAQRLMLDQQLLLIKAIQTQAERETAFHKMFGLQVVDVGDWPDKLTLRREDDEHH